MAGGSGVRLDTHYARNAEGSTLRKTLGLPAGRRARPWADDWPADELEARAENTGSASLLPSLLGRSAGMLWLWTTVKCRLLSTLMMLDVQRARSEVRREGSDE